MSPHRTDLQACRVRRGSARRALLSAVHEDPSAAASGRLLQLPRAAAEAEPRRGRARAAVPRAEPAVSSRLLLQRDAGRAPREPGAVVVSERRVPDAAPAGRAHRVPAEAGRAGAEEPGGGVAAGAAGAARGSVRAERGARRDSRLRAAAAPPEVLAGAARARAAADRGQARRPRSAAPGPGGALGRRRERAATAARFSKRCATGCSSGTTSPTCSRASNGS